MSDVCAATTSKPTAQTIFRSIDFRGAVEMTLNGMKAHVPVMGKLASTCVFTTSMANVFVIINVLFGAV